MIRELLYKDKRESEQEFCLKKYSFIETSKSSGSSLKDSLCNSSSC